VPPCLGARISMNTVLNHFLASKIVTLLMTEPGLSAEAIRSRVGRVLRKPATLQGVYKELRRLQKSTVVFKARGRFFLSLPWLLESRSELERGIQTYSSLSVVGDLLPQQGESQTWRFSDIHAMDRLVVNLLVTMLRHGDDRQIYHWDPYPWYAVFHADLAAPFLKEFLRGKHSAFGIIGAESPISDKMVTVQKAFSHTWWIGTPLFAHREDTALSVKPPFVLSIRYPQQAISVFRGLFSRKNPFTTDAVAPFHALMAQKLTYRVTLQNNPRRSQMLAKSFRRLFELA
jgi:hypothetical protein